MIYFCKKESIFDLFLISAKISYCFLSWLHTSVKYEICKSCVHYTMRIGVCLWTGLVFFKENAPDFGWNKHNTSYSLKCPSKLVHRSIRPPLITSRLHTFDSYFEAYPESSSPNVLVQPMVWHISSLAFFWNILTFLWFLIYLSGFDKIPKFA